MDSQYYVWIAIFPALLFAVAPVLMARKDPARRRAVDNYARKVDLRVTEELHPIIVERIKGFEKATLVGAVAGGALSGGLFVIIQTFAGRESWTQATPLMIIVGIALGMAYGPTLHSAHRTIQNRSEVRVARTHVPTLEDYVPRIERVAGPLCVGLAVAALIIGPWLFHVRLLESKSFNLADFLLSPGAVLAVIALIVWLVGLRISAGVLNTGQPAETTQELAWDDALRAVTLRSITQIPFFLGGLAAFLLLFEVIRESEPPSTLMAGLGAVILFGLVGLFITGITMYFSRSPARYFRSRLWKNSNSELSA